MERGRFWGGVWGLVWVESIVACQVSIVLSMFESNLILSKEVMAIEATFILFFDLEIQGHSKVNFKFNLPGTVAS